MSLYQSLANMLTRGRQSTADSNAKQPMHDNVLCLSAKDDGQKAQKTKRPSASFMDVMNDAVAASGSKMHTPSLSVKLKYGPGAAFRRQEGTEPLGVDSNVPHRKGKKSPISSAIDGHGAPVGRFQQGTSFKQNANFNGKEMAHQMDGRAAEARPLRSSSVAATASPTRKKPRPLISLTESREKKSQSMPPKSSNFLPPQIQTTLTSPSTQAGLRRKPEGVPFHLMAVSAAEDQGHPSRPAEHTPESHASTSPIESSTPLRRLSLSRLSNQLSKHASRLAMELLVDYYKDAPAELETLVTWLPYDEDGRCHEAAGACHQRETVGAKRTKARTRRDSTREGEDTAAQTYVHYKFDPAVSDHLKQLLAVHRIDFRIDRTFPHTADIKLVEQAIREGDEQIGLRKRAQALEEALYEEKGGIYVHKEAQRGESALESGNFTACSSKEESSDALPLRAGKGKKRYTVTDDEDSGESNKSKPVPSRRDRAQARDGTCQKTTLDVHARRETPRRKTMQHSSIESGPSSPPVVCTPKPSADRKQPFSGAAGRALAESMSERLRPRSVIYLPEEHKGEKMISVAAASVIHSIDLSIRFEDVKKPSPGPTDAHPKVKKIVLGDRWIRTWYNSPYPAEYVQAGDTMYVCPLCLKYMNDPLTYGRHKANCNLTHPPGREIYREREISVFEVDGYRHKLYCQNLCLLAKLFLDHKILYYDVNAFLFYVLTEFDPAFGYRFVGYFSKERSLDVNNNVSCIVVLPGYQNRGYGHFLIDFSYLLTRRENKVGGPETPLSDLGFVAYAKYWAEVIVHELQSIPAPGKSIVSYEDIAKRTGIYTNHLVAALEWMECLVRTRDGQVVVNFEKILKTFDVLPTRRRPDASLLKWSPLHST